MKKPSIRPLHTNLIVEPLKAEEVSKGGILLPPTAQEKPLEGMVLAVGKGVTQSDGSVRPLDVKVGDRVLYTKFAGHEITVDGSTFLMMKEDEILGVVV